MGKSLGVVLLKHSHFAHLKCWDFEQPKNWICFNVILYHQIVWACPSASLEGQICRFHLGPGCVVVAFSILTGSKTRGPELSPHCYLAKVETSISGAMYPGVPRNVYALGAPSSSPQPVNQTSVWSFWINWNCRVFCSMCSKTMDFLKETIMMSEVMPSLGVSTFIRSNFM